MSRTAFSRCISNQRLFIIPESATQSEAQTNCEAFKSSLGPIRSASEYNETVKIIFEAERIEDLLDFELQYFIGLEAGEINGPILEPSDTTAFQFLNEVGDGRDDVALEFYHVEAGEFPWDDLNIDAQPNNAAGLAVSCGGIRFSNQNEGSGLLHDIDCNNNLNGGVCRGSCLVTEADLILDANFFKIVFENENEGVATSNQAIDRCSFFQDQNDKPLVLGATTNKNELDLLINSLSENSITQEILTTEESFRVALGLKVPESLEMEPIDTSSFLFLDEDVDAAGLDFFQVDVGEFPWKANEPNNVEGDEHCALLELSFGNNEQIEAFIVSAPCRELTHAMLCVSVDNVVQEDEALEGEEIQNESPLGHVLLAFSSIAFLVLSVQMIFFAKHCSKYRKMKRSLRNKLV